MNFRLEVVELIVAAFVPPDPSFLIKPLTDVKLFVASYLPPPPVAVKIKEPAIFMVLPPPASKAINKYLLEPDPFTVSVDPEEIELPVLSIVIVLFEKVDGDNETEALFEIVKLFIVGVTSTIIEALLLMITSSVAEGTPLVQLPLFPQLLLVAPVQVVDICPSTPFKKNKFPAINRKAYKMERPQREPGSINGDMQLVFTRFIMYMFNNSLFHINSWFMGHTSPNRPGQRLHLHYASTVPRKTDLFQLAWREPGQVENWVKQ